MKNTIKKTGENTMINFFREARTPYDNMTSAEFCKIRDTHNKTVITDEFTDKIATIFNINKSTLNDGLYCRYRKKGSVNLIKQAIDANLLNPCFLYAGDDVVNFDPADLIDFIFEHSDKEITVLYEISPKQVDFIRIDGIEFSKDADEALLKAMEAFRRRISKDNRCNKGRKYTMADCITYRWDRGALRHNEKNLTWEF